MSRTIFGTHEKPRASSGTRPFARAWISALAVALVVASLARVASAQDPADFPAGIDPIDIPPERDPLAHAWDRPSERGGFYARGSLGLGFVSTRLGPPAWDDDDYQAVLARGFGTGFGLDVGGMLAPWVALHLSLHAGMLWNGDLDRAFGVRDDLDVRVGAYGAGPAVTFFTPRNFYFGGAFGVGLAHTKYRGYSETTDPGFYMKMTAGKDLYVGRNFSFGLQFQIVYMLLGAKREVDEARVREFLFGVSFAFDSI